MLSPLSKERFNANLRLCLWMLILQRNVFSGIVDQAHTTVGMAETEIMEVYPTTNKAMLQVQVSSPTPYSKAT